MKSEIPFFGIGAKNTAKTQPLPPAKTEKNKSFLTLLREESQTT